MTLRGHRQEEEKKKKRKAERKGATHRQAEADTVQEGFPERVQLRLPHDPAGELRERMERGQEQRAG